MPQLILEHSANLALETRVELQRLLGELHRTLVDVGGIALDNCKSRALRRDHFRVGDGAAAGAFVHLEARILAGRDAPTRRRLGEALLAALTASLSPVVDGQLTLQVTVELVDMPRDDYFKAIVGRRVAR